MTGFNDSLLLQYATMQLQLNVNGNASTVGITSSTSFLKFKNGKFTIKKRNTIKYGDIHGSFNGLLTRESAFILNVRLAHVCKGSIGFQTLNHSVPLVEYVRVDERMHRNVVSITLIILLVECSIVIKTWI